MERKMDEQDILREVGIHRDAYRGSWVYELSGTVSNGEVVLAIYYEVSEKDISADIKHWRDIPHSCSAINNLLASMKLEEELPLPHVKHGRYHFFNALKPAAMYSANEVADAAAAPTMRWTLALWDEDQQEICVVKCHS